MTGVHKFVLGDVLAQSFLTCTMLSIKSYLRKCIKCCTLDSFQMQLKHAFNYKHLLGWLVLVLVFYSLEYSTECCAK